VLQPPFNLLVFCLSSEKREKKSRKNSLFWECLLF